MIIAGISYKYPREEFHLPEAELVNLEPWEVKALREMAVPRAFEPFGIYVSKNLYGDVRIVIDYPVPVITMAEPPVEAYHSREEMKRLY